MGFQSSPQQNWNFNRTKFPDRQRPTSLPGLGPRWFVRKPSKKVAIVAGAVGIGLAALVAPQGPRTSRAHPEQQTRPSPRFKLLRAASIGEAACLFPSAPAPRGGQAKAADSLPKRNGAALYVFCVVSYVTPQRQHARRPTFPPGVIFSRSRLCQSAPYECRPTRSPV